MSLRKLFLLTLVLILSLGSSGCSFFLPSARSIAEQVIQAQAKVNSLYAVWRESETSSAQQHTSVIVHYWYKKPDSFRYLLQRQGRPPVLTVSDGHLLWTYNQGDNLYTVTPLTETVSIDPYTVPNTMARQLELLLTRSQVALIGTSIVAGQPAYGLRLSSEDGSVSTVWIDQRTFQPLRLLKVNPDGSSASLDYQTFSPNTHLNDRLFRFSPPSGATLTFDASLASSPQEISIQAAQANTSFRFLPPQAPLPPGMTISKVTRLPDQNGDIGSITVFMLDSVGNTILISESAGPASGAEGPWASLWQGSKEVLNGIYQFHLLLGQDPTSPVILSFLENSTMVIISGAPKEEALEIAENLSTPNMSPSNN